MIEPVALMLVILMMEDTMNDLQKNNIEINYELLCQCCIEHGVPMPENYTLSNGFLRWGKHMRYWARGDRDFVVVGDFVTGEKYYKSVHDKKLTKKQYKRLAKLNAEKKIEQEKLHDEAAKQAFTLWRSLPNAGNNHPYLIKKCLVKKGIVELFSKPTGIKVDEDNRLVIPMYNIHGDIRDVQFIDSHGHKLFAHGCQKKGCFYTIGNFDNLKTIHTIYLCEGFATGVTLSRVFHHVVVCFDASNLKHVAVEIRRKYPNIPIVICADNDCENDVNTGVTKADEAAAAIANASVIIPSSLNGKSTDFNDLWCEMEEQEFAATVQECKHRYCTASRRTQTGGLL